ncbi:hypothetical protein MKW92_018857 [Papaver armeniacum]|nr:hypothetical protein MKW92_018857 [Papaver armeniacum]
MGTRGEIRISIRQRSFSYAYFYQTTEYGKNLESYRPLVDAAMDDKWDSTVENLINSYPCSVNVPITVCGRTALHIAAGAGHSNFVLKLVECMHITALELKDSYDGNTALHLAVIAGLDEAVKAMVEKHGNLTRICNKKGLNPLLNAAMHVSVEHAEIIRFLCENMKDEPTSFQGHSGAQLICSITRADLYELASNLIHEHPSLAIARDDNGNTVLDAIAEKDLSIPRAYEESTLSLLTYHQRCTINDKPSIFLKMLFCLGGYSKVAHLIRDGGSIVQELVKLIFKEFPSMTREDKYNFFFRSNFLKTAAKNGSIDIVKGCISTYPDQLWLPHEGRNIFQIAVENRQEKIFNYLYDHMNADEKILTTRIVESNGGNILHVAAKIAPPPRLNIYTSPVVQMQSEINWFKKVEKRVPPALRKMRNDRGETPQEVFTREHKDLVKTAEAYMIRTAESCLIVAALVATVAFAAAITLPGGTFSDNDATDDKGKPIFLGKKKFLAFMVADALALFCSTRTILLFLSIFIGNHNEGNFEIILPKTLKRALGSLILSVFNVVIAFCLALSIILDDRYKWAPYLIGVAAYYSLYVSFESLMSLFNELNAINLPVLYWAISRDHQPNVPLVLKNV